MALKVSRRTSPLRLAQPVRRRLERAPVEPLFALNARGWLSAWTGFLVGVLLLSSGLAIYDAGSWSVFVARPDGPATLLAAAALLLISLAGAVAYRALLQRAGLLVLFMLGSTFCTVYLSWAHEEFWLLTFPLILQAYVFLPFMWAIGSGAVMVAVGPVHDTLAPSPQPQLPTDAWTNLLLTLMVGALMGSLTLYIHRANQETRLRQALIERLEAAQRDLAERERAAGVAEERARLSRDLHDTLAQGFTGIVTRLSAAELACAPAQDAARGHVRAAREMARTSLAEIRQLVWALRPAELAEGGGLDAALRRVSAEWSAREGLPAEFMVIGPARPLLPHAEVALLRTLQEALSNVARHAQASRAEVRLIFDPHYLMLEVEDDGRGFIPDPAAPGFGLRGLRERAEAFGGHLLLDSEPGAGSCLTAAYPLDQVRAPVPA